MPVKIEMFLKMNKLFSIIFKKNFKLEIFHICFLGSFVAYFIYKNFQGYHLPDFGDEAGHFLGALSIMHGDVLYRDFVDAHGPIIFFLTQIWGLVSGAQHIETARFLSMVLGLITAACIYTSPLFSTRFIRVGATALWLALLTPLWCKQGLATDSYWTVGGCLTAISLVSLSLPLSIKGQATAASACISGVSLVLLSFTAYSFLPVAACLGINDLYIFLRKREFTSSTAKGYYLGISVTFILFLFWLLYYADIKGLFIYHFYVNQFYYSKYIPFNFSFFISSILALSFTPNRIIHTCAVISFFAGGGLLFYIAWSRLASFFILVAVLVLNLRGYEFQDGAFLISSLTLFSCTFMLWGQKYNLFKNLNIYMIPAFAILVTRNASQSAVFTPWNLSENNVYQVESLGHRKGGIYDEIRKYAASFDNRILVFPYDPAIYLHADRLPMKINHAYLPWEHDYGQNPFKGYSLNLCNNVKQLLPSVIVYNKWVVWGRYDPEKYAACTLKFMRENYTQSKKYPEIYIYNKYLKFNTNYK